MKKENRLKKRKEFAYIFKKGEAISARHLVLTYTKSKLKNYKVGFSCGKKVGIAVVRNKVKRRIKEAVYFYRYNIKSGYNYIFVAKQNASMASFEEIKSEFEFLLKKANVFVENQWKFLLKLSPIQ